MLRRSKEGAFLFQRFERRGSEHGLPRRGGVRLCLVAARAGYLMAAVVWAAGVHTAVAQSAAGCALRLNQIQVIGTHNSYHAGIAPSAAKVWQQQRPDAFPTLDYRHPPLREQLASGVRQIELDIYAGRFVE